MDLAIGACAAPQGAGSGQETLLTTSTEVALLALSDHLVSEGTDDLSNLAAHTVPLLVREPRGEDCRG